MLFSAGWHTRNSAMRRFWRNRRAVVVIGVVIAVMVTLILVGHTSNVNTKLSSVHLRSERRESRDTNGLPTNSTGEGTARSTRMMMEAQQQRWELSLLRSLAKRKDVILSETHDEMMYALHRLRSALHKLGESAASNASRLSQSLQPVAISELPCHCLEQSAMSPQDVWCDNRRSRLSGAHVCVLRNVCFGGGETIVALSPQSSADERRERSMEVAGVKLSLSVAFHPLSSASNISSTNGSATLYEKIKSTPIKQETAVFYASQYPSHITHVLEGAGGLHLSVHRNKQRVASHPCDADDLTCFYDHITAFNFMGVVGSPGEWHERVLRIMLEDHSEAVPFHYGKLHIEKQPFQCYARAIVPGFYYSVFPDSEDTKSFQWSAATHLERAMMRHGGWKAPLKATGKIVMSHRMSKRTITDWSTLVAYVRRFAEHYQTSEGLPLSVEEVTFRTERFLRQATLSAEADVLMGIHGADLTNVIFQRRGAVLLELNPLLFFENRFFELASNLGIQYMTWTCTHAKCAFGGADTARLRKVCTAIGYDADARVLRRSGVTWPHDRYVGYACPDCTAISSVVRSMGLRDSDIRVDSSLEEIGDVLERAFAHLGYRGTRPSAPLLV